MYAVFLLWHLSNANFVAQRLKPISADEAKAIGTRVVSQAQQLLAAKH